MPHILMGMMVIKGIYAKHGVQSLNHGIGFNGAAIELLLPTYGEQLGLKGKICRNWVLNPHPTLIPAIEAGWVKSICAFGGEAGYGKIHRRAQPTSSSPAADGTLRSQPYCWHRWQASTPSTASWALPFRWTTTATPPP